MMLNRVIIVNGSEHKHVFNIITDKDIYPCKYIIDDDKSLFSTTMIIADELLSITGNENIYKIITTTNVNEQIELKCCIVDICYPNDLDHSYINLSYYDDKNRCIKYMKLLSNKYC